MGYSAKRDKNRLDRTHFDNRFAPAIKGHAGLLSEFTEGNPMNLIAP
jgi:hypothetical protein